MAQLAFANFATAKLLVIIITESIVLFCHQKHFCSFCYFHFFAAIEKVEHRFLHWKFFCVIYILSLLLRFFVLQRRYGELLLTLIKYFFCCFAVKFLYVALIFYSSHVIVAFCNELEYCWRADCTSAARM